MSQAGLDISGERSEHLSVYESQTFDHVITVCDDSAISVPCSRAIRLASTELPDPAAVEGPELQKLAAFQETVDGMRHRISTFIPVAQKAAASA